MHDSFLSTQRQKDATMRKIDDAWFRSMIFKSLIGLFSMLVYTRNSITGMWKYPSLIIWLGNFDSEFFIWRNGLLANLVIKFSWNDITNNHNFIFIVLGQIRIFHSFNVVVVLDTSYFCYIICFDKIRMILWILMTMD